MIQIEVTGRPAPKGSRIAGMDKSGHPYTRPASRYERPWVDAVAEATRVVMRHRQTLEPPYRVELSFAIPMPNRRNRKRMHAWPTHHDLDKLVRAVVDGLVKGKAIEDDRHLIELNAHKAWAQDGQEAGVQIEVSQVAQDVYAAA